MKRALVCGAGGFIGSHMVRRLKDEGYWVMGVDLKVPEFSKSDADEFELCNLHRRKSLRALFDDCYFDLIIQLAADMGGAGFIFTGENDADIMHNSASINLNILDAARKSGCGKIFYSSSACIYPAENQADPNNPVTSEASAYPANPDSDYGWEKLFSERLYMAYARNYGLDVRIARYHNIFGREGTYEGGREKAPAALCRKVAEAQDGGSIDIWGDGRQTRSFLYIDECIEGTMRLIASDFQGPVNIGSDEMVSINDLAQMIMGLSGKELAINHIDGPLGVRGRTSDNDMIWDELGWRPERPLIEGLEKTYSWIAQQVRAQKAA